MSAAVAPAADRLGDDRLRVAVVAPPWYPIPPTGYGGVESVVAALVEQLVAHGHEVTLLSAGEHGTSAQHAVRIADRPDAAELGRTLPEVVAALAATDALRTLDVDLVHDHTLLGPLLAAEHGLPTVCTMHNPVTGLAADYWSRLAGAVSLVAISAAQRRSNPGLPWAGVVHNAIDVAAYPVRAAKGDAVLWLGRFSPDKGAALAIDAARAIGRPIVVAGTVTEPSHRDYVEAEIVPRLGPDVRLAGELQPAQKRELLADAWCLAFPIQWDEPFGLVMVEALACGTPVAAIGRGSVPEVLEDGVTGALAHDAAEFPDALRRAGGLAPADCRRAAEQRFDLPVMAAGYEQVYRRVLERQRVGGSGGPMR